MDARSRAYGAAAASFNAAAANADDATVRTALQNYATLAAQTASASAVAAKTYRNGQPADLPGVDNGVVTAPMPPPRRSLFVSDCRADQIA